VGTCKRVLAVEEGVEGWGFASEVAHALVGMNVDFDTVASPDHPIPSAKEWEIAILPSCETVVARAIALVS
jgi:pyruvate/2-oxoglutarate/acetoin dehydrogenase E1 component